MIKNVVFDVGGVLMAFDTHAVTAAFTDNEADAQLLHREIFDHADWVSIDRGSPEDAALARMKSRLPERLHGAAEQVMAQWERWLEPDEAIDRLGEELAGLGCALYILSNTSAHFHHFCERIPLMPKIRGTLLSYEEQLLKPDLSIYRRLFSKFGLIPDECFFIDDNRLNIEAACWIGMYGCQYGGDIAPVRAELRRLGVPVAP